MKQDKERRAMMNRLLEEIQSGLGFPPDLVRRSLVFREEQRVECLYLESMADKKVIDDYILSLYSQRSFAEGEPYPPTANDLLRQLPFTMPMEQLKQQAMEAILSGNCVLLDGFRERLCFLNVQDPKQRPIEEPKSESTIRGPHEGFTETLMTNMALIRKRIRNPYLRFEKVSIGSQTNTTLLIVYLENLAPEPLVQQVRERIAAIRTDSVLESAYVEEYIQDAVWTPFPTVSNTERPDTVVAQLLDGKVAIMVEGTPSVLLAPMTFFEFFSSPEDYYQRADIATFIRFIRLISFFTAVFVPSLYVAATTFHQELLPTQLLISLSAQREGVPFVAIFEVLLMEVLFEIIREAGLRMPRAVGQALSIVGAIVLGQAAVEAGLVSAAIVIVVAVTGITNFVVPVYSFGMSQRLLRFTFLLLAGFMGLFGVLCGALLMLAHLVSLKSFGVPYMTPAAPTRGSDWKDVLVRLPRPQLNSNSLPGYMRRLKRRRRKGRFS